MMGQSIFQTMQLPTPNTYTGVSQYLTPYQKMMQVVSAMRNPAQYLKDRFPDIPDDIMYDSNRVFEYLQRTHGFSKEAVEQTSNQIRGMMG